MAVGLGAALALARLPRVAEADLDASLLQHLVRGDPVGAGGLPGHGGDAQRQQPGDQGVLVADEGAELAELRPGFVYEFRLKHLAPSGQEFYPAEAHYTLRVVPREPGSGRR